jgi:hypothetical protein
MGLLKEFLELAGTLLFIAAVVGLFKGFQWLMENGEDLIAKAMKRIFGR